MRFCEVFKCNELCLVKCGIGVCNEHARVHGDYHGGCWEKQFEVHSGKHNPEKTISGTNVY